MLKKIFIFILLINTSCGYESMSDSRISPCENFIELNEYRNTIKEDYSRVSTSIQKIEESGIKYFRKDGDYCQYIKKSNTKYCIIYFDNDAFVGGGLEICHNSKDNSIIEYRLGE